MYLLLNTSYKKKMAEKFTVITGASTGIGRASALEFAKKGKNLIVGARNETQLNDLADEIKEINPDLKVIPMSVDLSVEKEVYDFYEKCKSYDVETWMNNAGIANLGHIEKQDIESLTNMIKLNVLAATILSSLYVKDYIYKEGTTLLNVGSETGYAHGETAVVYSATKFYLNAFTENLYYEVSKNPDAKLRVKLLAPNVTRSKFYERATGIEGADEKIPVGNTSEEMANFAIELYESDELLGSVVDFKLVLRGARFEHIANDVTQ